MMIMMDDLFGIMGVVAAAIFVGWLFTEIIGGGDDLRVRWDSEDIVNHTEFVDYFAHCAGKESSDEKMTGLTFQDCLLESYNKAEIYDAGE